jgi:hypothetical protein
MKTILTVLAMTAQVIALLILDMTVMLSVLATTNRLLVAGHCDRTVASILSTILAALTLLYLNLRPTIRHNISNT